MCALPTLYEYYTSGGISAGLSASNPYFTLNNKNITVFSGALHYFRVPPEYWRDRLRKARAAGLNAVETYVPWNLHEPEQGVFDFGEGGTDFQDFLNIEKFLKTAQEEDLLVIARPGPYICAEWEFGGMPSWLLRDQDMKIRTSDASFVRRVESYFGALLKILSRWQFTRGGPIIAFQIENEYGNTKVEGVSVDTRYLEILRDLYVSNGIVELLFTSDTPSNGNYGSLPGVLNTANFQSDARTELELLRKYQPGNPLMVMEYWTGWFDHWTEKHHTRSEKEFSDVYETILQFPASVNMYMFHGGTNWGFLNGANVSDLSTDNSAVQHDTTGYDYDAPLTETGDYTDKYYSVRELVKKYNKVQTTLPDLPKIQDRVAYPDVEISEELSFPDILDNVKNVVKSEELVAMESLPINNNNGQSYGYVVYRKQQLNIPANSTLKIGGHVCDTVMVLLNGRLVSGVLEKQSDLNGFGYWRRKDSALYLGEDNHENAALDLVVENCGRNNYGKLNQFNQQKGLWQGKVYMNDQELNKWEIYPLEFKKSWTSNLKKWGFRTLSVGPKLYKAVLDVLEPQDTYFDMRGWNKGVIIVNGFVLARYLRLGPQQTAYLPAPFLTKGKNEIVVFEHFKPADAIKFSKDPIYETLE